MSPIIFDREQITRAIQPQDRGQLKELDSHQLLQNEGGDQIVTFDQVVSLGEILLRQQYGSRPLTSSEAIPQFVKDLSYSGDTFLAKIAFQDGQFPATVEVIQTQSGPELKLHIVPVHLAAFEAKQFSSRTDALVALAAAAVVAPQFLFALKEGLEEEECETPNLSVVQPEHGAPLAVIFDSFHPDANNYGTLKGVQQVIKNQQPTLKDAAHIHGKRQHQSQRVLVPAGKSALAGGLAVHSFLRTELPKHALFFPIKTDFEGNTTVATLRESLTAAGLQGLDAAFIAAALGMTSHVVGRKEKTIENVFDPKNAEEPLEHIILRSK